MSVSEIILNTVLFLTLYVQVLLLFTFLEKGGGKRAEGRTLEQKIPLSPLSLPAVAIIVPCWNEERTLAGTVRSLLALEYPKEKLQVLIVDDGSTDKTLAVAKRFECEPQVRIFTKENGGKHTALNFGIANSQSELVGCLDADAFVERNALLEVVREFRLRPEIMAVTPAIRVFEPKNMLQRIQRVEYNMGIFLRKMFSEMNAITVTPGPFSLFRREVFRDLGEYRKAHNTEDMEYALRMHKNHYPIGNAHMAFVHTVAPSTFRGLIRQRLRWVYGFLKNAYDYRMLLLNKKYGNVGVFSMPIAVLSIFTVIYYTSVAATQATEKWGEKWVEYETLGWRWPDFAAALSYDWWFFWNTNLTNVIVVALFASAVAIVFIGQKLAEGRMNVHSGIFYFFLLYGLLAPIWIFRAVWNVIFSKKTGWR